MVLDQIFGKFPAIKVPVTVEARLDTNDGCIAQAMDAFVQCGAGFKNSTASNDKRMQEKGWKSANIVMRPLANAHAMVRLLQAKGRYDDLCGVIRLGTGGFYEEISCAVVETSNGPMLRVTEDTDVVKLGRYAELAADVAKARGWHLILASKRTISRSEQFFHDTVAGVFKRRGLVEGEERTWTGDWHAELSDMALARLSIVNGDGRSINARGKFLLVADNEVGDTASDIVDLQAGGHAMSSTIYGWRNDKPFSYEELPGGTADGKTTGPLKGDRFLSPVGIILGLASAFESVNPDQGAFFEAVRRETLTYMSNTPAAERDTERMIARIAMMAEPKLKA
jgi:hypothetical protein